MFPRFSWQRSSASLLPSSHNWQQVVPTALHEPRCLRLAKIYWSAGDPLPLDIEADLMALGFDVPTLHHKFITHNKRQKKDPRIG
ncbi:hypothetical protein [Castellaniella sp.]|uniref:hypothetical protein n=1 Tax=Castellaniella sp. TaxID=1955812 RepID=UPI002AFE1DB8|nr:hypothetical protein [Castellaniella sp.]